MEKKFECEVSLSFTKISPFYKLQQVLNKYSISYKALVYVEDGAKVYEISWDDVEFNATANLGELVFEYTKAINCVKRR